MQQRAREKELVRTWIDQYGRSGYSQLERSELAALLQHLHPEAGAPDDALLDVLIMQATEVRTYSMFLQGNPNLAVSFDLLMQVVRGYAVYRVASQIFEQRSTDGVIALRDLPQLMREVNDGDMNTRTRRSGSNTRPHASSRFTGWPIHVSW